MHQSLVKSSESEASNHMPSLADFTTTTPELKFSVHTGSPATPRQDLLRKPTMSYVFARLVVALEPLRREICRGPNASIRDRATIQKGNRSSQT
jgi:hypothetical protein